MSAVHRRDANVDWSHDTYGGLISRGPLTDEERREVSALLRSWREGGGEEAEPGIIDDLADEPLEIEPIRFRELDPDL